MAVLIWDQTGERFFETGIDHGVFYPATGPGVAWNGLTSVDETPSGGEVESLYYDGDKYFDVVSSVDFQATISAYSAPPEFLNYDGQISLIPGLIATGQDRRARFGLSYRTKIGNDVDGDGHGYKLHIVYNLTASPSNRSNRSDDTNKNPLELQWQINAVPPTASTYKPTAHFIFDSTQLSAQMLADIEGWLYGTSIDDPILPPIADLLDILTAYSPLDIVPDTVNGLAGLVTTTGDGDLSTTATAGLLRALPYTRLTETATPGLFTWS